MTTLQKIGEKHNDWVNVCISFGCNKSTAEDLTQEMYLKLATILQNNSNFNIYYNDTEINHFYIYRVLKSLFIDLCRKEAKVTKVNIEHLERFVEEEQIKEYKDIEGKMKELDTLVDKLYWYDAKVWRLIAEEKMSIAQLSKESGISYYSLYNTYKNVKSLIKNNIQWD